MNQRISQSTVVIAAIVVVFITSVFFSAISASAAPSLQLNAEVNPTVANTPTARLGRLEVTALRCPSTSGPRTEFKVLLPQSLETPSPTVVRGNCEFQSGIAFTVKSFNSQVLANVSTGSNGMAQVDLPPGIHMLMENYSNIYHSLPIETSKLTVIIVRNFGSLPTLTPINIPSPTLTPINTAAPTQTPVNTPSPTLTPINTPAPTQTPIDTVAPTLTPINTPLPTQSTLAPASVQGCGHGYWKQPKHFASWPAPYAPTDLLNGRFNLYQNANNDTLLTALRYGGGSGTIGSARILLRHATAALLNAASTNLDYPLPVSEVINQVNAALASNNRGTMLNLAEGLDKLNNAACPLDSSKDKGQGNEDKGNDKDKDKDKAQEDKGKNKDKKDKDKDE